MQQDYAIVAHKETMKQFIAPNAESGNRKITKSMLFKHEKDGKCKQCGQPEKIL